MRREKGTKLKSYAGVYRLSDGSWSRPSPRKSKKGRDLGRDGRGRDREADEGRAAATAS